MKVVSSLCSSVDPDRHINILSVCLLQRDHQQFHSICDGQWALVRIHLPNGFIDDGFAGRGGGFVDHAGPSGAQIVFAVGRDITLLPRRQLKLAGWGGGGGGIRYDKRRTNKNEITENHPRTKWALEKCFEQPHEYLSCRCGSAGKCIYRMWTFVNIIHYT